MRNAFADELTHLAEDPRVVALSGDIGNRLFDRYKEKYPKRFYNCGVAEANMIGMAAGLAMAGLRPICYTITPFITYRCMEQIRVDVCYHNLPVIIVGTGSGLSYASLGATHHSLEEIAMLRTLPNMQIVCPADAWEVRAALREALKQKAPLYLRLGKKGEPQMHNKLPNLKIGKALVMREGKDFCLLSTGNMLPVALETAKLLAEQGLSAEVVSFHTVKPLDSEMLHHAFSQFQTVVSMEEHTTMGGFGSSLLEWKNRHHPKGARILTIGTSDTFLHDLGNQAHARRVFGLTPENIVKRILGEQSLPV